MVALVLQRVERYRIALAIIVENFAMTSQAGDEELLSFERDKKGTRLSPFCSCRPTSYSDGSRIKFSSFWRSAAGAGFGDGWVLGAVAGDVTGLAGACTTFGFAAGVGVGLGCA